MGDTKMKRILIGSLAMFVGCGNQGGEANDGDGVIQTVAALQPALNLYGIAETVHSTGAIDRTNPFFQKLGVNQRTCETCHSGDQGWTITAVGTALSFLTSGGQAPVFMLHDAGSRPDADISTLASRWQTFRATLVKRGLIRFGRTLPATSEFTVTAVSDPAGFATPTQITNFRRPTPTSNESKVADVLWTAGPHDVPTQVASTAGGAARFHEQRVDAVPPDQQTAMRDFMLGVSFAQSIHVSAGRLDADGAKGGPTNLQAQAFYVGINDIQGGDPMHPFSRKVFDLFDAWAPYVATSTQLPADGLDAVSASFSSTGELTALGRGRLAAARASIYRGQDLFNNREFDITGVHGLNDLLAQTTVRGTCSTCHNAPNVGGHSVFRMFDVGTADPPNCSPDLPLLTLQNNTTLVTRKTCDLGRGGNGKWDDVGGFRAPPLRGLAARAPYFHDGQAESIKDVISYFDRRFSIGLTTNQKRDLEAFLSAL